VLLLSSVVQLSTPYTDLERQCATMHRVTDRRTVTERWTYRQTDRR